MNRSRIRLDEILPEVYADLKSIASRALRNERAGHSYQTTELVHEIYLRLSMIKSIDWNDHGHLLRAAAGVVRRVLIDYARSRQAIKRTPDQTPPSPEVEPPPGWIDSPEDVDLLELEEALTRLETFDARKAEIVQLRYFAGQDNESIAKVLGISPTTVKREWTLARTWLQRELS